MSVDSVRHAVLASKQSESASCVARRLEHIRSLYSVASFWGQKWALNAPALSQVGLSSGGRDRTLSPPPSPEKERFIDETDLTKGRYFPDDALRPPSPTSQSSQPSSQATVPESEPVIPTPTEAVPARSRDAATVESAAKEESNGTSTALGEPVTADATLPNSEASNTSEQTSPEGGVSASRPENIESDLAEAQVPAARAQPQPSQLPPDGPSVDPKATQPLPEDDSGKAHAGNIQEQASTPKSPARGPATVHLPPKEVQEKHVRDTEHAQAEARDRERKEDEHLAVTTASATAEAASSPGSTQGATSTFTPRPGQQSPDTSPDEDSYNDATASFAAGAIPSEERQHDKWLHAQMKQARAQAREGNPATPDAQLRLEEEQAIKSRRDYPHVGFAPPEQSSHDPESSSLTANAEKVALDASTDDTPMGGTADEPQADTSSRPSDENATQDARAPHAEIPIDGDDIVGNAKARTTPLSTTHHDTTFSTIQSSEIAQPEASGDVHMADAPSDETNQSKVPQSKSQLVPDAMDSALTEAPETINPALLTRSNLSSTADSETQGKRATPTATIMKDDYLEMDPMQFDIAGFSSLHKTVNDQDRDYFEALFEGQANASQTARSLLTHSRKAVTTADYAAVHFDEQRIRNEKRIYQLQNANKWPLRQMKPAPEPRRPITHRDHLLAEMKWMWTDFREEKKWKVAMAKDLAYQCKQFVESDEAGKIALRVKIPKRPAEPSGAETQDGAESPPELISSGSNDSEIESLADEYLPPSARGVSAPALMFALGPQDYMFPVHKTPAVDKVLQDIPAYQPFVVTRATETRGIVPVSKFNTGKLAVTRSGPPKKRSRYDYEESEDEAPARAAKRHQTVLLPESNEVALFNPENKSLRARLHANSSFRPPSEFPMPSAHFFENRSSSHWTVEEDTKLRELVKEYQYNWSLIAAEMSKMATLSVFTASTERRTPWECFEKWVGLEGLPVDMQRTQYFRTWEGRRDAARRNFAQQYAQMQQKAQQGQTPGPMFNHRMRRSIEPARIDKRRDIKYLAVFEAMRKSARKRENTAHKAQEAAKAAMLRKQQENPHPKSAVHTPLEFSKLLYKRNLQLAEQREMYRQQMAQKSAQMQAQRAGQVQGQAQATPNSAGSQQRTATPAGSNGQTPMVNTGSQPGQMPPNPNMQAHQSSQSSVPNGAPNGMPGMPMGVQGVPQAQMQANMQSVQRLQQNTSPDNPQSRAALQHQTQRIQQVHAAQQGAFLGQQQFGVPRNVPAAQMMGGGVNGGVNGMPNPAVLAQMKGNVANRPVMNSMPMGHPNGGHQGHPHPGALSSGTTPVVQTIAQQIRSRNPNLSPGSVESMATEQLQQHIQQRQQLSVHQQQLSQRQNALNAAAGMPAAGFNGQMQYPGHMNYPHHNGQMNPSAYHANGHANMAGGGSPQMDPQQQMQYRQMLQQRSGSALPSSPSMSQVRPGSRSATPQGTPQGMPAQAHQRTGSNTSLQGSPRMMQGMQPG